MSKFYITHVCGHEQTHQIYGPENDRDRKAEWLAESLCSDCKKKEKEEQRWKENERNQALAKEQNLLTLSGTEKQVAWAVTIRQNMIDCQEIAKYLKNIETKKPELVPEFTKFLDELKQKIYSEKQAKWFIENQDFVDESLSDWVAQIKLKKDKNQIKETEPIEVLSLSEIEQLQSEIKQLKEQYQLLQKQQEEREAIYETWLDSMENQYKDIEDIPSSEWEKCPPFEPPAEISQLGEAIAQKERILNLQRSH